MFNIGDKVKVSDSYSYCDDVAGETGKVVHIKASGKVGVCFNFDFEMGHDCDGRCNDGLYISPKHLSPAGQTVETINSTSNKDMSIFKSIPATLKRILNKDLSAMYKVGFINGDLKLTDLGVDELLQIVALSLEKELGERATEIIDEAKKSKKDKD